jgi:hypothetical protein
LIVTAQHGATLQYDDAEALRKILKEGGIRLNGAQSAVHDSRPLLYAAYADRADAVKHLLNYGVDENELDRLIVAELLLDADCAAARGGFLTEARVRAPPRWWEGGDAAWARMTLDAKRGAYLHEPRWWKDNRPGEWARMPPRRKTEILMRAHRKLSWTKLYGPQQARARKASGEVIMSDTDSVAAILRLDGGGLYNSAELNLTSNVVCDISGHPMLKGAVRRVSKSANSDTCPRPTTGDVDRREHQAELRALDAAPRLRGRGDLGGALRAVQRNLQRFRTAECMERCKTVSRWSELL